MRPNELQEDEARRAEMIRDQVIDWVRRHRAACPVAKSQCCEPAALIAFLAHCVGIRSTDCLELQAELAACEAKCANCAHWRN